MDVGAALQRTFRIESHSEESAESIEADAADQWARGKVHDVYAEGCHRDAR